MLGITAVVAVAAAVIVTVANGRHSSPEHDATAAYIKDVDTVQQQMRVALTKATTAYRDFAGGKVKAASAPSLVRAEATLRTLQQRLTSLPAPPVAAKLRRLLADLAAAEVSLAGEVRRLAVFAPRFNTLVGRSRDAGTELSRALGAVEPPTPHRIRGTKKQVAAAQASFTAEASHAAALQADAIDAYDKKVAAILARLRRLQPPPVLEPAFQTQIGTLNASRTAGDALAHELRRSDRSQVSVLGRRFTLAARRATSVSAQKSQISAVKSYNARVRAIGSMQARIQGELARLQRTTD